MPRGNDQEKTEPATPKRRQEARKKGQVAQSKEIPSVLVLLGSLGFFFFGGANMLKSLSELMKRSFVQIGTPHLHEAGIYSFLLGVLAQLSTILMPLILVLLVAGLAANYLQVGFLFTAEPLIPKLSKIDPVKGMGRIFSAKSLVELIKSIFKIIIIGYIAFLVVRGEADNFPSLMEMGIGEILFFIGRVSFNILFYTSLAFIVLAALDYAFQRFQHEKSLKMSRQEVKDEFKQREGDPLVKSRIRRTQIEMARRRMMEAVPAADVVMTNPDSLAVALKYDAEKMAAPRVIAKGAGFIAERIKQIAKDKGIPVVEHKLLTQTLFKVVEIGGFIPVNLYRAVAEILAYVYRLKNK